MKISIVGPVYPYRGGISHYTTSLTIALINAGNDVKVFSFKRQYPAFLYPGETDKDPSANPLRVETEYLLDPIYPWTWLRTARAINESETKLVLIQWWTTFWSPAYAALAFQLRKKVPIVYLIHNVLPHENRVWDRWLARLALGRASAFIVQTENEQKRLHELIPHARTSRCGHPIYQQFNNQPISKGSARQQLGLPMSNYVFLFFGIVRPYKGLKVLIEALTKTDPSIHLIIAGEFWESVELYKNQIAAMGLNGRVTLIDKYLPNEEAHIVFSSADALVAPYVNGTQSGVAELALGYGLPAIVTDKISAGITETAIPLKIVPAGDAAALTHAMDELAKNLPVSPRTESSDNSWKRMVETILSIQSEAV